jgi:hypothetical protein
LKLKRRLRDGHHCQIRLTRKNRLKNVDFAVPLIDTNIASLFTEQTVFIYFNRGVTNWPRNVWDTFFFVSLFLRLEYLNCVVGVYILAFFYPNGDCKDGLNHFENCGCKYSIMTSIQLSFTHAFSVLHSRLEILRQNQDMQSPNDLNEFWENALIPEGSKWTNRPKTIVNNGSFPVQFSKPLLQKGFSDS